MSDEPSFFRRWEDIIKSVRPDPTHPPVTEFATAVDPVDRPFKRGDLRLIVAGSDTARSVVQRQVETEAAIMTLGTLLYRHSPTYAYDNASPQDALQEAREIVTRALKGEGE